MFSVLFPGQGSQSVGMAKNIYENFDYIRSLFKEADEILNVPITKIILDGPSEQLNKTENTQPAIFLVSFSIFNMIHNETSFNLKKAKFFAGHSLGEYSALACSEAISFQQTLKLLKARGNAMQNALPNNEGGMLAVLGSEINKIDQILKLNQDNFKCYVANDNCDGQCVVSGKIRDIELLSEELKKHSIKSIKLPVSAPFHCELMKPATEIMKNELMNTEFNKPISPIISNVTAKQTSDPEEIKKLLIQQIEKPVRWRESVINMINLKIDNFIEIGPGKILSGIIKRIDRKITINQVNELEDVTKLPK